MNLKNLIKPILYILGGVVLGGSISYFLAHREIKKLEETVMYLGNDFVNFQMKYVPKERQPLEWRTRSFGDFVKENKLDVKDPIPGEAEAMFPSNPVNKSIEKPDISTFKPLSIEDLHAMDINLDTEPFLVAENAIDLNDDKYDSEVGYTYYQDGILVDELDEIIIEPDAILPSGWRDCFGWNCRSDDMFFAVNPKLRLLIEVVRSNISYAQWIEDDYGVEE